MSPKRALFSLNLNSDADHYHQHVTEHYPDGKDSVKVVETKGPTHGHKDISYLTKPFEKVVNRAVDDVVKDTGKKVGSVEGDVVYSSRTETNINNHPKNDDSTNSGSNLAVKNKSTRRFLERTYDTSEL